MPRTQEPASGYSKGVAITRLAFLQPPEYGGPSPKARIIRRVLAFIEQHYRTQTSLREIAASLNFSPTYLTDLVRRETGLPVHRWIVEYRLAEAKRLLVNTDLPVARIAECVGFADSSHLCRNFVKIAGLTPGKWRREKRWSFCAAPKGAMLPLSETDLAMMKVLLDEIEQLVWAKDADGNLFYANKQWHRYTGQTREQSVGWGWLDAVHPSDVNRCLARWSIALATGMSLEYQVRLRRAADSTYRRHLFRTAAHRLRDGTRQWVGSATDIQDLSSVPPAS
jgi:PAS domain S-box-containing protein